MIDETKPIGAGELIKDPDLIVSLQGQYVMLKDSSVMGTYTKMIEAINIMGEYGWEAVSIAGDASSNMYALCRNTHYKRKNQALSSNDLRVIEEE